ncbi:MAG: hypothetical protein MZW92_27080 [Comamonadaceae bacterium]|nr:hypothetical protein [Comamonadaceae bacterium]
MGHEDRLERVIGHLVQNALRRHAVPKRRGPGARVSRRGDQARGRSRRTTVQGMTAEFIRDAPVQALPARPSSTGMGIGSLREPAVRAAALGGRIDVESATGRGHAYRCRAAAAATLADRPA